MHILIDDIYKRQISVIKYKKQHIDQMATDLQTTDNRRQYWENDDGDWKELPEYLPSPKRNFNKM